jgi:hypothetical protein
MHTLEMKKKKKNHKKQGCGGHSYTKCGNETLFHSPMCTNQPLRVMELEVYKTNTFAMSFM